jgi:dTDP-glucose 4,6-dehydratase
VSWVGKRVLVTGAGGFIGSHLTERLVELGATTRAFVHYNALGQWGWLDQSLYRNDFEVIAGDICDRDSVSSAMEKADMVFHLAALIAIPYSYYAPISYVRTNVEGTLNVLQAAYQVGVQKMIHTSTSEVYGTAQYTPIDEAHPLQGQSPYSASKIGADKIAESFNRSFNVPVVTVRPFNTFGPRQSTRAVIPTVLTQAMTGVQEIRLGNLLPRRDMLFVEDTVQGFLLAAEAVNLEGQVINLGTGHSLSVSDLAQSCLEVVNCNAKIVSDVARQRPQKSEVDLLICNASKARRLLGWTPKIAFREGLHRTADYIRANLSKYHHLRGYAI